LKIDNAYTYKGRFFASLLFSNIGERFSSSKSRNVIRIAGSIKFLREARRIVFSLAQNEVAYTS